MALRMQDEVMAKKMQEAEAKRYYVRWEPNLPIADTLGPFKLSLLQRCPLFGGQIVL